MNAHAMVGPFTANFNSASTAKLINQSNFADLPIVNGDISLDATQALYLYGGRKSLQTALDQLGDFRVKGSNWDELALFRVSRSVAGSLKSKQLLVITPVPNGIPTALKPTVISLGQHDTSASVQDHTLKRILSNLPKK